ncbi:carotenoid oxygenase family protein, partial [Streptomyces sp. NPDC004561]
MTEHTRRTVLRGAAGLVAAGALTGPAAPRAAARGAQAHGTEGHLPFLEGAFAPVTEELTAFDLPVTGRVPRSLNGRYLRNGPNVMGLEDPRAHHWMTGDGMVHGVRLRDGRAEWYRNRWVRSSQVAQKLGEPYRGPVPPDDFACNTHVIPYRGRILALQESGPLPYELDGELGTAGTYDFGGTLEGAFTAHTKFDAHAGELHAIAYYPTWDHVRHLVVDPAGRVARTTRIPVADAPMMHDFALTERHVVVVDMPVTFDAEAAGRGAPVPYVWNREHPTRVGVMPRAGGPVRWFGIEPVFYSHTLNAYAEGDCVVVDLTTYPAPFQVAGPGTDGPRAVGTPGLERWTIDPRRGQVRQRVVDDRPQEFPRVNESLVSRRHRYGYAAAAAEMTRAYLAPDATPPDRAFSDALVKHDLSRGTA